MNMASNLWVQLGVDISWQLSHYIKDDAPQNLIGVMVSNTKLQKKNNWIEL
jgi:hypothetical protein